MKFFKRYLSGIKNHKTRASVLTLEVSIVEILALIMALNGTLGVAWYTVLLTFLGAHIVAFLVVKWYYGDEEDDNEKE